MAFFLILVVVVLLGLTLRRMQVAARGQRLRPPLEGVEPVAGSGAMAGPDPDSQPEPALPPADELPLSPRRQVRRAVLAAKGTRVRARHNPRRAPKR